MFCFCEHLILLMNSTVQRIRYAQTEYDRIVVQSLFMDNSTHATRSTEPDSVNIGSIATYCIVQCESVLNCWNLF